MDTQLTLDIAGVLEKFSHVFDLDIYAEERDHFIADVKSSGLPLKKEIVEFARERDYPLNVPIRVRAAIRLKAADIRMKTAKTNIRRRAGRIKRRLA